MSKFVRKSNGKSKRSTTAKSSSPGAEHAITQLMPVHTASSLEISSSGTPLGIETPANGQTSTFDGTRSALNAVAAGLAGEEPDGAIVHTIAVGQLCFKIGRITVPPGLVLAINGFTGAEGHSLDAPHPQWVEAKKVMSRHMGGSSKKLRALLTGGWKDVPEKERWWEKALGPDIEAQRVRNLASISGLKSGMENARVL